MAKQLKIYSQKEESVKKLESELRNISSRYDEMKYRMEAAINSTVSSKTIQYESLLRDLTQQVSKLLYENTKLRRYFENKMGQIIMPLHPDLVVRENMQQRDIELYDSIEGLVSQNTELKTIQVKMASSSVSETHRPKEGHDAELKNLIKRVESADREKETLQKSLEEWRSHAKKLIEQSADNHRQLSNYQHEYSVLDQKYKNSGQMVARLKTELENIESVAGYSTHTVER